MNEPTIYFVVVLGSLAIVGWFLISQWWVWFRLSKNGVKAFAVIQEIQGWKRGNNVSYSWEFTNEAGTKTCYGKGYLPPWLVNSLSRGYQLGIRYDKTNPKLSRIEHEGYKGWGFVRAQGFWSKR